MEFWDTRESSEPRRIMSCPEDFRGGRPGAGGWEPFRVGNGGGPFRLGSAGAAFGMSLSMGGGRRTPLDLALAGSLFACLVTADPNVGSGGLFIVLALISYGGRSCAGRGRSAGLLVAAEVLLLSLSCDCFKAAIRSARELNFGSSISDIVQEVEKKGPRKRM